MKSIKDIDCTDKRVLIRIDVNVSLDDHFDVKDEYKLRAAKETIDYVMAFPGARVGIMSHLGRPEGKREHDLSLMHIADDLEKIYERTILPVCESMGVCVSEAMEKAEYGELVLIENLRFHPGEKENDEVFAQQLAAPFDLYVNDAFAVSHRAHASVEAITRQLPSYAGIWFTREVERLTHMRDKPQGPAVAIIGGAKIATKIPLIESFEKHFDKILVGGLTAVEAQEQGLTFSEKVILPVDYANDARQDIGPKTIVHFLNAIEGAQSLVWNGPLGMFEEKPYDTGTRAVADAIVANKHVKSLVGGGESIQALRETGHFDKVSFVSTGGGAMLAFLSGESMPGIDALEK